MHERRRYVRYPSLLGAKIAFTRLSSTIDCTIRNISPGGGRVVFTGPVAAPKEFDLHIPHRRETRRARVIWRTGEDLGVAFVEQQVAAEPVSLDAARRMRRLEQAKAELKRRVEELSSPPI